MNTQIHITENGATTLATVGKYCDRNIDVNVDVPSNDAEQKAITDSILDRSITEFSSDTLTEIGAFAFYYCRSLHTVNCPQVKAISRNGLGYCTVLKRLDFAKLTTLYGLAFGSSSALDTLILRRNLVCDLKGTDVFTGTPIASGTGYIYVPDNLVERYKTATNWVAFADQIKPISELEE